MNWDRDVQQARRPIELPSMKTRAELQRQRRQDRGDLVCAFVAVILLCAVAWGAIVLGVWSAT